MPRLLVNAPTDEQQLINIGAGGSYFDQSRVIWDERTDGPLPDIQVGGMVRDGNVLVFDQDRMNLHNSAIAPPVPKSVPALAGLLALEQADLGEAYDNWATAPQRTRQEKAFINKAQNWKRNDPVLLSGAQALGVTNQLDALFIAAGAIADSL